MRTTLRQAVHRINTEADVIWAEGHSDYGHALSDFVERWGKELTPRTTVLVLGDARNNYHSVQAWAIAELARRSRQVWWLNPEPAGVLGYGRLRAGPVRRALHWRLGVPQPSPIAPFRRTAPLG